MYHRKFVRTVLVLSAIAVLSVGLFNFIIDPFQQYRKATLYPVYFSGNQRYMNPGLAKNYNYESVLIGSSMTENFLISDLSFIIPNPIKLCISSASAHDIFLTMGTVFDNRRSAVKSVMLGLDINSLSGDVGRIGGNTTMPAYLYDSSYLNDGMYLLNLGVLKISLKSLLLPFFMKGNALFEYEHMYQWENLSDNLFGKEKVLNAVNKHRPEIIPEDWRAEKLVNSFNHNIMPFIKDNPDVSFIIFYPPYSYLTYEDWAENGVMNDVAIFKKYLYNRLAGYKNVRLYDFQSAADVTGNLDLYSDINHYSPAVNKWMIEKIRKNEFIVTKDNIDAMISAMTGHAESEK